VNHTIIIKEEFKAWLKKMVVLLQLKLQRKKKQLLRHQRKKKLLQRSQRRKKLLMKLLSKLLMRNSKKQIRRLLMLRKMFKQLKLNHPKKFQSLKQIFFHGTLPSTIKEKHQRVITISLLE